MKFPLVSLTLATVHGLAMAEPATLAPLTPMSPEIAKAEREYFSVTAVPTPEGSPMDVSGLEMLPDGKLAVANRRGEIWMVGNPADAAPLWHRWAHGLHEPMGISWRDGWLWATQRPEVTRMKDTDGDGRADVF
ncbi:MAG: hypothetical protein KGQ89_10375, partial [Verrucomicrobia bacterium]|nr:hypothetical protein [Verrucomicrobiota bacterium]